MVKAAKDTRPIYDAPFRTPLQAMRIHCLRCMGGSAQAVAACLPMGCTLHPFRHGVIPSGAPRHLLSVLKRHCEQCAPDGDVRGCTANLKFEDNEPCALWPHRLGKRANITEAARSKCRARAIALDSQAYLRNKSREKESAYTSGHVLMEKPKFAPDKASCSLENDMVGVVAGVVVAPPSREPWESDPNCGTVA